MTTSSLSLSLCMQEHRTEIDARTGTFQAFEQFGQQLLARGHYASPEIQEKLEALDRERADLEKAWVQRRVMLDQCLELQVSRARRHACIGWRRSDLVCWFRLARWRLYQNVSHGFFAAI